MFTEALIVLNATFVQRELIKPVSIQIVDIHQARNVFTYDLPKNTIGEFLIELDDRIDFCDRTSTETYNRCFSRYFQF